MLAALHQKAKLALRYDSRYADMYEAALPHFPIFALSSKSGAHCFFCLIFMGKSKYAGPNFTLMKRDFGGLNLWLCSLIYRTDIGIPLH